MRQNTWPALAPEPRKEARGLYKLLFMSEPPGTYVPTAQAEGSSGLRKPSSPPHPPLRRILCRLHSGFIWGPFLGRDT